ncbi:ABC transporter ATP-binding protein, partial [Bdellovibrionota bacterium FG-2]
NDLFEHLLGLSADHFTAQSTGTLISRVGSDPQNIDGGIACIHTLVREPLTFVFLFGNAWLLNWKLTLVTLLIFPPLAYVFSATGRNLKRYISRMNEENARLYSTLQESFSGIRVVKMFALEKYVRKKFREKSQRFTKFLLKTAVLEEASHPMVELLTAFAIAAVIYFGGRQVLAGKMTPGDLLAFFTSFALMMNPIRSLNEVNIKLNQAATSCNRIFEIFDWKSNLPEITKPVRMDEFHQEIRVANISFAYPDTPQRVVLKNVDFVVPRGKIIALVGASGSGKSSMVNLITRIFDVTAGRILFDGVDLRHLDRTQLRKMVAVVSQDVFLFNDTIEENIRCGRLSATHEEILQAAEKAHAMDFIRTLPEGLNSIIGDRGQKLSGGERQRISIARAFLRQAPLLILDEATSSLDTQAAKIVH